MSFFRVVFSVCSCPIFFLLWFSRPALADELRPAYLELRQIAPDTFDALWKVPAAGSELRLALYVRFSEGCSNLTEPRGTFGEGAYTERWQVKAPGGLFGERITIEGLAASLTDALVRVQYSDGTTWMQRLTPQEPSAEVPKAVPRWHTAGVYLRLGVEHILSGLDHLLFVLALVLITIGGWKLVKTVTAFTVAHSITLTAATLGFVHVPQQPVEAVIALSIVFVAAEIVHARQGHKRLAARAPWVVAFAFGLLHGFGFAGALSEIGLPQAHIPLALVCFNLGVEVGQLIFVGVTLSIFALAPLMRFRMPPWAQPVPPYAIGTAAAFWFIQRVAAF